VCFADVVVQRMSNVPWDVAVAMKYCKRQVEEAKFEMKKTASSEGKNPMTLKRE